MSGVTSNDQSAGPGLLIRAAGPADVDAIARLHASCFERSWSQRDISAMMDAATTVMLVACCDLQFAGFVIARVAANEAEILSIAVYPAWRRRALASELLASLEQRLVRRGVQNLFLEVDGANAAAIALYRGYGFGNVGVRRNYYRLSNGALRDALVLQRSICQDSPTN